MSTWVSRVVVMALAIFGLSAASAVATTTAPAGDQRAVIEPSAPEVGTVVFDQPAAGQEPGLGSRRDLVVYRDGELTQLTHNVVDEYDYIPSSFGPTISPDGSRILYVHCKQYELIISARTTAPRGGRYEACTAWLMGIDGSDPHPVRDADGLQVATDWYTRFDWGPSGEVAFIRDGIVRLLDPGTGAVTTVLSSPTKEYRQVRWLGADRLVFLAAPAGGSGDTEIWTMRSDGSDATDVSDTPDSFEYDPVGSADGSMIAYQGQTEWGDFSLYVMNADGSSPAEIHTGLFYPDEYVVGWSTDLHHYGMLVGDTDDTMSFAVLKVDGPAEAMEVLDFVDEPGLDWLGDVDERPVAVDQLVTVPQNGSVQLVLEGWDPDGTPVTWEITAQPEHGTLSGAPPQLTYAPALDYHGHDSFTFRVASHGLTSPIGTVQINVVGECTITGTVKRDVLHGTDGDDVICALGGADVVLGGAGDDVIFGGGGDDDLVGGSGVDEIDGGRDNDAVRGDAGADILIGGEGRDAVSYYLAPDGVRLNLATQTAEAGSYGVDLLTGFEHGIGSGTDDSLIGDGTDNILDGLTGADLIKGGSGADLIRGGRGHDELLGANGADLIWGGTGKDLIRGGLGRDVCYLEEDGKAMSSCENKDGESGRGVPPGPTAVTQPAGKRLKGYDTLYWKLGNDDYAFVYSPQLTASLQVSQFPSTRDWERRLCRLLGSSPARAACTATDALQVVQKSQVDWFVNRAVAWNACGIVVWDKGHHGLAQWKTRWKVRPAQNYFNHVAEAWVTPGRVSYIETSDPDEVGGAEYIGVKCP